MVFATFMAENSPTLFSIFKIRKRGGIPFILSDGPLYHFFVRTFMWIGLSCLRRL